MYFVTFFHHREKVLQILEISYFRVFEKQLTEIFSEQVDKLLHNFQLMEFVVVERQAGSCCSNVVANEYHSASNEINLEVVLRQKEEPMFSHKFPVDFDYIQQARYLLMVIVGHKPPLESI